MGAIDMTSPVAHRRAREAAEEGMQRVLDLAERATPGWAELAYAFVCDYAKTRERFTGWMMVQDSRHVVPPPPNPKAWGPVILRAARRGVIRKVGHTPDVNRHGNPIPVWGPA